MNKVFLSGRLGKDPELKKTRHDSAMCKFSLATSEVGREEGKTVKKTGWHNIVVFNRQAETCHQYLKKGSQALIDGKLVHRSWDKDDGTKGYSTEIHAHFVEFQGGKEDREKKESQDLSFTEVDIPF